MFHRLSVPSYFGGLPAGYDYINNAVSGTPANMDGQKVGGVNAGTYLVAFGEDATSSFANRGLKALSQNTDIIDDILHRDLAMAVRTADTTVPAGPGITSVVITGEVFVGRYGVTNNQDTRDQLISVLDNLDEELVISGTKVVAASIVDNNVSSNNLVGTQASGFYNGPTVNFNVTIPPGTIYRVYYGERGNLATLPQDAFTSIKIRGAQEVASSVEEIIRGLHSVFETDWLAPWTLTIKTIAYNGLGGAYANNTYEPTSPSPSDLNRPGAGAVIRRLGQAITMSCPNSTIPTLGRVGGSGTPLFDPILACYRVLHESPSVSSAYDGQTGADVGLFQESTYHSIADGFEGAYGFVPGPLLLDVVPRNVQQATIGGHAVITKIHSTVVGLVNPDSGTSAADLCTIQVGTGDFVRDGSGNTIARSTDLVEVTDNGTNTVMGVFHVDTVLSSTRIKLRSLTGNFPTLGVSGVATPARFRLLQPTIQVGGRYREAVLPTNTQGLPSFAVVAPSPILSDWGYNSASINAIFLSAMTDRSLTSDELQLLSMAWGGFNAIGYWSVGGYLSGDGSILTFGGRQRLHLQGTNSKNFAVADGGRSIVWNPAADGSHIQIYTSGSITSSSPVAFSLSPTSSYDPLPGDKFDVFVIINKGIALGLLSITWPADFIFSGVDGVIPTGYPTPGGPAPDTIAIRYQFEYVDTPSSTGWYATRTDY